MLATNIKIIFYNYLSIFKGANNMKILKRNR